MTKLSVIPIVLTFLLLGCKKEVVEPNVQSNPNSTEIQTKGKPQLSLNAGPSQFYACGDVVTSNIFAGQHHLAGTIMVSNDNEWIKVEVSLINGWTMSKIHLFAGLYENVPLNSKGNPKIGNFPIQSSFSSSTSKVFWIPANSYTSEQELIIAFHAEVTNSSYGNQTAWADGSDFPGGSWATYLNYDFTKCLDD